MTQLGGHALYLKPGEIHLGARESLSDTAHVLERMVDAIEARTLKHATVLELALKSHVPVINGLTDYNHPTQVLCDVFTMMEHAPPKSRLEDLHVTFIGDATNVCNSLAMICTQMGMHFTHAAPKRYQLPEAVRYIASENCKSSGGSLVVTEDVEEAVRDAHFLYTDLWWWIGQESEIPDRQRAFMPRYQLNAALLAKAPRHCRVMHCLPASRGVEATDEVLDCVQSIIFDQAENRLHTEKALLVWFIYPHLERASSDTKQYHAERVRDYLAQHAFAI
jgi:putrescine carbamoyltransferase